MSRILVLTSRFLPNPDANGLITKYIIDELKRRGHDVTCISVKENYEPSVEIIDGVPIYRISQSFYSKKLHQETNTEITRIKMIGYKLLHLLRKVKLAVLLLKFPDFDLFQSNKVFKLVRSLNRKEKFDLVIGVFKPYSNMSALMKLKTKHPNITCVGYYLDLIDSSPKPSYMPNKLYEWLCFRGDFNTFSKLDYALVAKKGKKLHVSPKFDTVREKIRYVNFPTFNINKNNYKNLTRTPNKLGKLVITYAGTLNRFYRNPSNLLNSLMKASAVIGDIELHIYGLGNCDEIIKKYQNEKTFRIFRHGLKSHDEVMETMTSSDFVVNISNKKQNAVPSKIFELFSIGKPIINVVFDEMDITTEYFVKYPSTFNIKAWDQSEGQINELIYFLKNEKGKQYDIGRIKSSFIENTPEYTVNLIEEWILNDKYLS